MFFSFKSLLATAVVALTLSLEVQAHALVAPALGVNGAGARGNVQRPSNAKPCGNTNIAATIGSSKAVTLAADGTFTASITNFNGGVDGSRQVTAKVDASGTGKSFVAAQVVTNGDRAPATTGTQQLKVKLPAGTKCAGAGGKCLVSFTTAGGFGNCVVVQQGGAAAAAAPAAGAAANTGKKGGKKAGKGAKKQGRALSAVRSFFESLRTARAVGSRAAVPARRDAEDDVVEFEHAPVVDLEDDHEFARDVSDDETSDVSDDEVSDVSDDEASDDEASDDEASDASDDESDDEVDA